MPKSKGHKQPLNRTIIAKIEVQVDFNDLKECSRKQTMKELKDYAWDELMDNVGHGMEDAVDYTEVDEKGNRLEVDR